MINRIRKTMEEREEGFTLIELLVVMLIIGILAAIAIPLFLNQKNKAYESSEKSDLHQIATAISTAQVDDPDSVALSGAGTIVTLTPTTGGTAGTAQTITLSPGNSLAVSPVTITSGTSTWCVAVKNSHAGSNPWQIAATANGATSLSQGSCGA